ncbi:hypothetical protein CBL_12434 [Carabus blaptoides fortunei]
MAYIESTGDEWHCSVVLYCTRCTVTNPQKWRQIALVSQAHRCTSSNGGSATALHSSDKPADGFYRRHTSSTKTRKNRSRCMTGITTRLHRYRYPLEQRPYRSLREGRTPVTPICMMHCDDATVAASTSGKTDTGFILPVTPLLNLRLDPHLGRYFDVCNMVRPFMMEIQQTRRTIQQNTAHSRNKPQHRN